MAGRSDIQAGGAFLRLYTKDSGFTKGIDAASKRLDNFGQRTVALGGMVAGMGAAIVDPLAAAVNHFADFGDTMSKASQRTGMTTEALSELGYAAGQSGSSLEEVEGGVKKMQKTIDAARGGNKEAAKTLTDLGISMDALNEPPDAQLELFAERIAGIEDPAKRTAMVMKVFGKSGANLLPLFADGAKGIQQLREEAVKLGQSVSPEDAAAATNLGDAWDRVKSAGLGMMFSAGSALAEPLTKALKVATEIAATMGKWVSENKAAFRVIGAVGAALVGIGTVIATVGGGFMVAGAALLAIKAAIVGIGAVAAAVFSPIGLAVAGIAAAVGVAGFAFWKLTDPLKAIAPLAKTVMDLFKGITRDLAAGNWAAAADKAIAGVKLVMLQGTLAVLEMWKTAIQRIAGFFTGSAPQIGAGASKVVSAVQGVFSELWGPVKASFAAFISFAGDAFNHLPALAGYAAGRMVSAIVDGMLKVQTWMADTFTKIGTTILEVFASLGPQLVKAIMSGDVGSLAGELTEKIKKSMQSATLAASGMMMAGLGGGEAPEFKISANTEAAMQKVADEVKKAQAALVIPDLAEEPDAGEDETVGDTEDEGRLPSASDLDSTPLEKYRKQVTALKEALAFDGDEEKFAKGLKLAREEFLALDPKPIEEYEQRMKELRELLATEDITQAEFDDAALAAIPDKVKQIADDVKGPKEQLQDELEDLQAFLDAGLLDEETYLKKKKQLEEQYANKGASSFVGYSATAAQAAFMGPSESGTSSERLAKRKADFEQRRMDRKEAFVDRNPGFRDRGGVDVGQRALTAGAGAAVDANRAGAKGEDGRKQMSLAEQQLQILIQISRLAEKVANGLRMSR